MAKVKAKTITTTITIVGDKGRVYAPGEPVTLPGDEADKILRDHGGAEVATASRRSRSDAGAEDGGGEAGDGEAGDGEAGGEAGGGEGGGE